MALTTGQSRARAALLAEQNRSAEDYTNDGTSGWDAVGRVKYNSDIGLARGIGGKHAGSAGLLNENFYNDLMNKGPSGLKIGDFLQTQNNGLDPSSTEYGQAVKNQRVSDLQKGSDWWDANPNGEIPSWMDKHGFALTAMVMSMGVGAAMMGAGAGAGALAGEGAAGAGGAAAGVGAGEAAAAGGLGAGAAAGGGAGAASAGGLGALGAGEAAAGLGAGAAIPTVTITGAAGGGAAAAGGLGSLGTAGALGAGAAGLGSLGGGGGAAEPPMQTVNVTGQNPNVPVQPADLSAGMGTLEGAMAGIPAAVQGAGSGDGNMTSTSSAGGSGGGYNWGNLINQGLGLIGGNVDRIKANQDADWWKGQLDTLSGMYKPGTPEATLMQKEMEAKDAAAGRRSQYGIRATDLAAKLAQQRAGIMTSAGYQNMANAYRNRSSQDLNGLFTAAGNMGGSNGSGWNTLINGIGSYFGGGATPPPSR